MIRDPAAARAALLDAGAWFAALVEELRPHHWTRPGLGVWDVRALVGHTHRALLTLTACLRDVAEACGLDRRPPAHVLADAGHTAVEIAGEGGHLPEVLPALTGRRPLPRGFSVLG